MTTPGRPTANRLGMTGAERDALAERIGIPPSTLQGYLSVRRPSLPRALEIAEVMSDDSAERWRVLIALCATD